MLLADMITEYPMYFDRLRSIYTAMDDAYNAVAAQYGFTCEPCPGNCCRTRFYNHTWLEYYYLLAGIEQLPDDRRQQIGRDSLTVCRQVAADEACGRTPRRMCPLNADGRCGFHSHRLMICRLHGVPHELRFPDGSVSYGQGCSVFSGRFPDKGYIAFDRTPFYREMSSLEKAFREATGLEKKFKMTIAQMIAYGLDTQP
jgi:GNAT superfamily N-acetyltransferase